MPFAALLCAILARLGAAEYQDSGPALLTVMSSSGPACELLALLLKPQPGPLEPVGKLALQIFCALEVAAMLAPGPVFRKAKHAMWSLDHWLPIPSD
jgi:hypothetical protein